MDQDFGAAETLGQRNLEPSIIPHPLCSCFFPQTAPRKQVMGFNVQVASNERSREGPGMT